MSQADHQLVPTLRPHAANARATVIVAAAADIAALRAVLLPICPPQFNPF
jgi:hypothetical protein